MIPPLLTLVLFVQTPLPGSWIQDAKLTAASPATWDDYGDAVAVSGQTAVVGMPGEDPPVSGVFNSGTAFVYERTAAGWIEVAEILGSDTVARDDYGSSVAIAGDTIVVGAPGETSNGGQAAGAAYVFEREANGTWTETAKLVASDGQSLDFFGTSVAVDGDTIAVGSPTPNNIVPVDSGSAYVFERNAAGAWTEVAVLSASDAVPNDRFGTSASVSGARVLIGAFQGAGLAGYGAAYVFEPDTLGAWTETAKLTASDGEIFDSFAESVSLSGPTALVGASSDAHAGGTAAGSAYVYQYDQPSGTWSEVAKLTAADASYQDRFGRSVSIAGTTLLVGASGVDTNSANNSNLGGNDSGAAYVFVRESDDPASWREIRKLIAMDAGENDYFGTSVSVSVDAMFVGAENDSFGGIADAGSAYTFDLLLPCTNCTGYCGAGTSAAGCQAVVAAHGAAQSSASDGFLVSASGVQGTKNGMFFFGTSGRVNWAWGSGSTSTFCVAPPVKRTGLMSGVGASGTCDGYFTLDLNQYWAQKPQHNPGAGALVQIQLWYRDQQGAGSKGTSLSDALEVPVAP